MPQDGTDMPIVDSRSTAHLFSGNIFIFHAFDIGDEIHLEKVRLSQKITTYPVNLSKFFKKYHVPLGVELPHPHESSDCMGVKLHHFGAMSLTYKIPFRNTLEELRKKIEDINNEYLEQSITDACSVFKRVRNFTSQADFFHSRSSYLVIQVDPHPSHVDATEFKKIYGGVIASTLRFETQNLSDDQKNDILENATGYFSGDFIVVDRESAFLYDSDYEELLDFFEFINIQHLELQYFDKLLDAQLNMVYEKKQRRLPLNTYLPFVGSLGDPLGDLGRLRVDISVITERLENSIKIAGEPYFSEMYKLLVSQLQLAEWQQSIDKKLEIVKDMRTFYQHKIDAIREDLLTMLIIVLIMIELLVAIIK